MNLEAIVEGAAVLIDANLLIYAAEAISPQCRHLLNRCAAGELTGFVSVVGLAEFCHRRMMQEAQSLGLAASNPAKALGQDPTLVRRLSRYPQELEDMLASELTVLSIDIADFPKALELQRQYGLLTNDSLHLAAGLREGLSFVATNDPHFDNVADITVFQPDDLT